LVDQPVIEGVRDPHSCGYPGRSVARASAKCGVGWIVGEGRSAADVRQARAPAIMWVSTPMTFRKPVPALTSSRIPAAAQRPIAPVALVPDQCRDLLGYLATITDPRQRRGRRHTLATILAVAAAAVLAGARSLAAIGEWVADPPGRF